MLKLTKLQKIFAGIYLLVVAAICLNALFSSPATPQNSIKVAGHFRTLDKETYRHEDSHELYLTESNMLTNPGRLGALFFGAGLFAG